MFQERKPEEDDLNFHCPVAEKSVVDLGETLEIELQCPSNCNLHGRTGELCSKIRREKAENNGEVTRETRYQIADKVAPHCISPRKLGHTFQDRYTKNIRK